jgi:type II secretion system protein H
MSRCKGFTLIEVMIVTAIMAIMATFAVPAYREFQAHSRLKGAARQMHADLAAIRMQAAGENRWIALNVDGGHSYTIFRDNAKSGLKSASGNEILVVKDLHPTYYDVTITTAAGTVVIFKPNGTIHHSVEMTLSFSAPVGTKEIKVSVIGRAKII